MITTIQTIYYDDSVAPSSGYLGAHGFDVVAVNTQNIYIRNI